MMCLKAYWMCAVLLLIIFPSACSAGARRAERLERRQARGDQYQISPILPGTPESHQQFFIQHDGLKRTYYVHLPRSYNPNQSYPVVMNFHGGGGQASYAIHATQMDLTADRHNFIVVYPEGSGRSVLGKFLGTWNAGRCCGVAQKTQADDVGFVRKMLDDLNQKFNVDNNRIYATGHSNGALFSYRLACEMSDRIAAIAPNSGHDSFDLCRPSRPVPVMHFHGTADPTAKYAGGHCGGSLGDEGWECRSVPEFIAAQAAMKGCNPNPRETLRKGKASCINYSPCQGGAEVVLCSLQGAGHTWPGGQYHKDGQFWARAMGEINRDISANEEMWAFFQRHPLDH